MYNYVLHLLCVLAAYFVIPINKKLGDAEVAFAVTASDVPVNFCHNFAKY